MRRSLTINDFNTLSDDAKAKYVWKYCPHISSRGDRFRSILLYSVNNFFVEVYFNLEYSMVEEVRTFTETCFLEPYIRRINIKELY